METVMFKSVIALALLALGTPAFAADNGPSPTPNTVMFPGSVNVTTGTIAPTEPGNVISIVTVEQGFTAWHRRSLFVVGFLDLGRRNDTTGHTWNNNMPTTAGVKLVALTAGGVVQAAIGVTGELGTETSMRVAKAASLSYWAGWRGDNVSKVSKVAPDAYPGHVYASSGYLTAREPENWTTSVSIEQGVTVFRRAGVAAVPYAGVAAGVDTQRYAWNNRGHVEAGFKLVRPVLGGVIDAGLAARREVNWITHASATGTVVFVNLWVGWNPRYTSK
jgi:hypothetical protein